MDPIPLPSTEQKAGNKTWIFLALGVLALLIIGTSAYFLFFNKDSDTLAPQNEENTATTSADEAEAEENIQLGWVTALEGLNLRKEASTEGAIILGLPYGTEVKIISSEGDWYFVEANARGFVAKEFIASTKPPGVTALKTFKDDASLITFLYPEFYTVKFTPSTNEAGEANGLYEYSFSGNDSFGGFKIETEEGKSSLGNYALINYPSSTRSACGDIKFAATRRECEKVVTAEGTIFLVLFETTLFKITYLKTEGGLLTDINNLVFYSFVVK